MNGIELGIFSNRIAAICDEMGALLQRAAFSTNIKDRLDFSCAIFDAKGGLVSQAAHIPVHLGSMAYATKSIINEIQWLEGDMLILNDPFLGGTHLPDITLIAPIIIEQELIGFVANRAHHADIGATTPGSMPVTSSLNEEGVIIPPTKIINQYSKDQNIFSKLLNQLHNRLQSEGDFAAQIGANQLAIQRLHSLIKKMSVNSYLSAISELNSYAKRLAQKSLSKIPEGSYSFVDVMEDDGWGKKDIQICATITVKKNQLHVDFNNTSDQVEGNINCPLSVAAAAVYYVFRCLMPAYTPACAGSFECISIKAPEGCLINATYPAAVAAGNVETSTRIVDVVMGALAQAIPERLAAASQGSMNNLAMGSRDIKRSWDYYETMGGGMGASEKHHGLSAVQTHMTNTLNTPIESLETHFPLRINKYAIRSDSGGSGKNKGGDGLIREIEFLSEANVTLLTERRVHPPWGLKGGSSGEPGINLLNGKKVPAKVELKVYPADVLEIRSPGGGGYGEEK